MSRTQPRLLPIVELTQARVVLDGRTVFERLSMSVQPGEAWQLHGPASSGKSILLEVLSGRHRLADGSRCYPALQDESPDAAIGIPPRFSMRLVSPQEQRRIASDQSSFYQARWHSVWTARMQVRDFLVPERVLGLYAYEDLKGLPVRRDFDEERDRCLVETRLDRHATRSVGQLSNGELKKLLLIAAHLASPRLLLLDDPLGGLDPQSRALTREMIVRWCAQGQTLVYYSCHESELANVATHHLYLAKGSAAQEASHRSQPARPILVSNTIARSSSTRCPAKSSARGPIISCRNVRVTANDFVLLGGLDWDVHPGEHWLMTGPNGAGKSTLLAVLTGDHPQAYANDVLVLGQRLGHDATLWQRRKVVGFVTPELSWHYPLDWHLLDVVLSGFEANIGLHRQTNQQEQELAFEWLGRFELTDRAHVPLSSVSECAKCLTLVARAMVQQPELLLLDEPTQNIAEHERVVLYRLLDTLAQSGRTTVVLVTHHTEERPSCITHQLALAAGRIIHQGPFA